MSKESVWREVPVGDWKSPIDDSWYYARVECTNGCGHLGSRQIQIRKGHRRDEVTGAACFNCGCKAEARG